MKFTNNTEINLRSLQAFLDSYFPNRLRDDKASEAWCIRNGTFLLLEDILEFNFRLGDIAEAIERLQPNFSLIELDLLPFDPTIHKWCQVEAARLVMELLNDDYCVTIRSLEEYNQRPKWKKLLNNQNKPNDS